MFFKRSKDVVRNKSDVRKHNIGKIDAGLGDQLASSNQIDKHIKRMLRISVALYYLSEVLERVIEWLI